MKKKKKKSPKYQTWIDARKKYKLTDEQIQMARELGLNPKKFGGLANNDQEPWKAPLPEFIQELYLERFGKSKPDSVRSVEKIIRDKRRKNIEKKEKKMISRKPDESESESQQTTARDTGTGGTLEY